MGGGKRGEMTWERLDASMEDFEAAEGPGAKGRMQPVETGKADFLQTPGRNSAMPPALCPRHLTSEVLHRWEHKPLWNPHFSSSHL